MPGHATFLLDRSLSSGLQQHLDEHADDAAQHGLFFTLMFV